MSHHAGLLQSLLVAVCLGLTMVLRLIPSAVLWGYFAFMALESLNGSQFWERLLYLVTDPAKRYRLALQYPHIFLVQRACWDEIAASDSCRRAPRTLENVCCIQHVLYQ